MSPDAVSHPRWDGRRMLFELRDADRAVPCAISLNALQDLSERRHFRPAELLGCFAAANPSPPSFSIPPPSPTAVAVGPFGSKGNWYPWFPRASDCSPREVAC